MTDTKSTKNKTKKNNTENVPHEKKIMTHIDPKQSTYLQKKMLTMLLLKKTLTIVKIIHRLSAAISFSNSKK